MGAKARLQEQHVGIGVRKGLPQLARCYKRRDRHQRCPGAPDAERRREPVGAVGGQQGDVGARAVARVQETRRPPIRRAIELCETQRTVFTNNRRTIARSRG